MSVSLTKAERRVLKYVALCEAAKGRQVLKNSPDVTSIARTLYAPVHGWPEVDPSQYGRPTKAQLEQCAATVKELEKKGLVVTKKRYERHVFGSRTYTVVKIKR